MQKRTKKWVIAGVTIALLFVASCKSCVFITSEMGQLPTEQDMKSYEKTGHYQDGHFINSQPLTQHPKTFRPVMLKKGFEMAFLRTDSSTTPFPEFAPCTDTFATVSAHLDFIWLGHSMFIIEIEGVRFLTDPVFGNAAPVAFACRRKFDSPLAREALPELDAVILSHDHYDHLERATIRALAARENLEFICPLGVDARLKNWGVKPERIHVLDWGDDLQFKGLAIRANTTRHFSGRSTSDRDKTLWCAYAVRGKNHSFYFAGDGGYGDHFKTIGAEQGPFDVALVEIGAWNKNWPNTHAFPEESAQAAVDLRAKALLPMHWATYNLSMHGWDEPILRLVPAAEKLGLPLITPVPGQRISTPEESRNWWTKEP